MKKTLCLFLLFSVHVLGQEKNKNDQTQFKSKEKQSLDLIDQAKGYYSSGQYDSALYCLTEVLNISDKINSANYGTGAFINGT